MGNTYLNKLFDAVIVGASEEGLALCEYLANKNADLSVLLITRAATKIKNGTKLGQTAIIEDELIYSDYNHGIVELYLRSGNKAFGLNIVLATGSKPKKACFQTPNVYYDINACQLESKRTKQAIVVGDGQSAVATAISASKKFRYVYLCSKSMALKDSQENLKRLSECKNAVHLPNCLIVRVKNNFKGELEEVTLDTYSTLRCNAIFAMLGRLPDVPQFNQKMIELDDGRIKTDAAGNTTKIPGIFAVGSCADHNDKKNVIRVGKAILKAKNKCDHNV